jgi:hypothetical protein
MAADITFVTLHAAVVTTCACSANHVRDLRGECHKSGSTFVKLLLCYHSILSSVVAV